MYEITLDPLFGNVFLLIDKYRVKIIHCYDKQKKKSREYVKKIRTHIIYVLLTYTGLAVSDRTSWISVVAFHAIVAMPTSSEVSALHAHTPAHASRQLVQFHVEHALASVLVAVAR